MTDRARIIRTVALGDEWRVQRHARVPELGPRVLFFSGGSALRQLSRRIKRYTHNSIHLITPFDSGGSSAEIRKAFQMLSVGDLRNRLMALADESQRGNREIYKLFSYRFPAHQIEALEQMADGTSPLVKAIPEPLRRIVKTHLRVFHEHMPKDFNLHGANIGNLVLTAGFLDNERDIDSVIFLFSKLVEVRGIVQPTVTDDLHLAATLADGSRVIGQHLLTGKQASAIAHPVQKLELVKALDDPIPAECAIDDKVRKLITGADVIVFPMGSFYSSVVANLLPAGVTQAIRDAECPKLYVPNTGHDPEELGMSLPDKVSKLLEYLRRDAPDAPTERLLNFVLLDQPAHDALSEADRKSIESAGVSLLATRLTTGQTELDPELLARALVSLG